MKVEPKGSRDGYSCASGKPGGAHGDGLYNVVEGDVVPLVCNFFLGAGILKNRAR